MVIPIATAEDHAMFAAIQRRAHRSRRGATAIEYGIIAGLIIVAAIGVVTLTGDRLESVFNDLGNAISAQIGPPTFGYPDGLPYQGLGIAPPSGPVTLRTETIDGLQVTGYAYADGTFYNAIDPYSQNAGENNYIAYKDGFVLKPGGQSPGGGVTTYSDFVRGCSRGGSTGVDQMAGTYTTGGTVSIASNGDWVCSGGHAIYSGTYPWVYDSVK